MSFLKYSVFPSVSNTIFILMGIGDFNRPLHSLPFKLRLGGLWSF